MKYFVFLFFFCFMQNAFAELPGLYKVSSIFSDEETGQTEKIEGTGILLNYKEGASTRFFILTVGHVSQGKNLQIEIEGKLAQIKESGLARLANNTFDVEWIEIEDPGVANPMSTIEHPCPGTAIVMGVTPKDKGAAFCFDSSAAILRLWNDSQSNTDELVAGENVLSASIGTNLFTLIPPWTDRGRSIDDRLEPYSARNVFITYDDGYRSQTQDLTEPAYGGEYEDFLRVRPGMSGSPLLSLQILNQTEFNYRIIGLVKEYDRRFFASEMVSESVILHVFNDFMLGKRGLDDGTQLLHRKGLSYRKYANGLLSVNPSRGESGNGEKGDGGNGEKGDGGNAIAAKIDKDPYSGYGILPGMALQNSDGKMQSVIALRSPLNREVIFADDAAADMTLQLGLKNFEVIELGQPLVPLLYEKVAANTKPSDMNKKLVLKPVLLPNDIPSATLRFDSNSVDVNIEIARHGTHDNIHLHFLQDGTCKESHYKNFTPVFSVHSENKKTYWIDLRRFFFTELSLVPYELLSDSDQRTPIIFIRQAEEKSEYELDFIHPVVKTRQN